MAKKLLNFRRLFELFNESKSSREQLTTPTHILVVFDKTASTDIAYRLKKLLVPEQAGAELTVGELHEGVGSSVVFDVAIFVAGSQSALVAQEAKHLAETGVPCAILADSSLDLPVFDDVEDSVAALLTTMSVSDAMQLDEPLAHWLVESGDKAVAFAASYSFCRKALVDSVSMLCAGQNAAVGAIDIIHGSDFPIMTMNQLKLALTIAAASGRSLDSSFVVDLALVLGCALTWRQLVRGVGSVLPIGNFVGRAAVGFAGTMVTARLLEARNDDGLARLGSSMAELKEKLHKNLQDRVLADGDKSSLESFTLEFMPPQVAEDSLEKRQSNPVSDSTPSTGYIVYS